MPTSSNKYKQQIISDDDPTPVNCFVLTRICKSLQLSNNERRRSLSESQLAKLLSAYKNFMEVSVGRNSPSPRRLTKLPHSLLNNFDQNGPLQFLLEFIIDSAEQRGCFPYELIFKEDHEYLLSTLKSLEAKLIENHFLKRPVIFFNKVPVKLINKLFKIVGEHGGQIVNTEEVATHIIEWNEEVDSLPEELADDYIRIIERKVTPTGGDALVHWWYYPDSYNEWISIADVNSEDAPDLSYIFTTKDKWTVCCRFITDCHLFNEWGNELDYENESNEDEDPNQQQAAKEASSPLGLRKKGRRSSGSKVQQPVVVPHRASRDIIIPEAYTITSKICPDLAPPSLQSSGNFKFLEVTLAASQNESKASESVVDKPSQPATTESTSEEGSKKRKRSENKESKDSTTNSTFRFPSWFSIANVSEKERLFFKDGYGVSREAEAETAAEIVRLKASIIDIYSSNPGQYLSATVCRRKIVGDAGLIIKTHDFLEAYGIINCDANLTEEKTFAFPSARRAITTAARALTAQGRATATADHQQSKWTPATDKALQDCVLQNPNDWNAVAASLSAAAPASLVTVTAEECLTRFLEMSVDYLHFNNTAASTATKSSKEDVSKPPDSNVSNVLIQQNAAALKDIEQLVSEYLHTRMEILSEKMRVLEDVEQILEIDRQRLESEKKDFLIQRSQFTYSAAKP